MPERDSEVFSNPLPPENHHYSDDEDEGHPLTNDDFRKMLMTPRGPGPAAKQQQHHQQHQQHQQHSSVPKKHSSSSSTILELPKADEDEDPGTRRRKKKIYYAKLKRMEEEKQKELEEKYRDRARERRDGQNKDYEETEIVSTTADYRAVAPDVKAGENYAERRKQVIQESKYLGGDMEHTHLVKGLDFALLEKVRAEISNKEKEDEEAMETAVTQKKEEKPEDTGPKIEFRTKMARNIYKTLFQSRLPERNELFLPKRMAYVVDLEDEYADSDVPTTIIRSKADCPTVDATTTLTTNDIVINKLTQILSYLRQGRRESKKLKKKEKGKLKEEEKAKLTGGDDNIYNDIGDYVPTYNKVQDKKDRKKDRRDDDRDKGRDRQRERGDDRRDRDRDRHGERRDKGDRDRRDRDRRDRDRDRDREDRRKKTYFEKPVEEDEDQKQGQSATQLVQSINDKFKSFAGMVEEEKDKEKGSTKLQKLKGKIDHYGYDECYPGEWQIVYYLFAVNDRLFTICLQ
ncbi:protein Red-like isoform X4 [Mytilus californianus]|uniref:protein Red-like isoform X4 n=1 Tax=Mytilus californianus TaxID=6549 RepID=UPI0022481A00|nr:protein Red-like isoform X4 [Mytilus californianus]